MSYLKEMADQGYGHDRIDPFHRVMIPYLIELLGVGRDDLIVDVGAAQGHCVVSAREAGYRNLAVLDIEQYNFDLFQNRYQIRCHPCDVENDSFPIEDNGAGLILAVHLIEHLRERRRFLSEAYRVLRLGGALALVTPDWRKQYKTFWRDPTHVHPYDKESITRLLRIHEFAEVRAYSWGSAYGLGRMQAFRWVRRLGLIGSDLLAVGFKEKCSRSGRDGVALSLTCSMARSQP